MSREELFDTIGTITKEKRAPIQDEPYLLVIQHPVTTEYGKGAAQIRETLYALKSVGIQTIMLWPNPDAGSQDIVVGIRHFLLNEGIGNIWLYRHFPTDVFVNLMYHCACMVGNSSAGIRETCYLGIPTVNIGTRQQGRESGRNVIHVGYNRFEIEAAIKEQVKIGRYMPDRLYGDGKAGKRIAQILSKIDISKVQKKITFKQVGKYLTEGVDFVHLA
jgi:UDP-hydrolysing UDP-N-acetyl-D-glucosamine 2-epimerase